MELFNVFSMVIEAIRVGYAYICTYVHMYVIYVIYIICIMMVEEITPSLLYCYIAPPKTWRLARLATKRGDRRRQSRNEICHWTNNEIGVAVLQFSFKCELNSWSDSPSRLEHLNGVQWLRVQIALRQLSIATSTNPSVANSICISSFLYTHVITSKKFALKQTWRLMKAKPK